MTVNSSGEIWDRLVHEFLQNDGTISAQSDFFKPGVDRVGVVKKALTEPSGNSLAAAICLIKKMSPEEQKQLFPQLVDLARAVHGPVGVVREIIVGLPRTWVLARIDMEVEKILAAQEYDDYWMFLDLYAALDVDRALELARRAAKHADPDIGALGREKLSDLLQAHDVVGLPRDS